LHCDDSLVLLGQEAWKRMLIFVATEWPGFH
jgi:hypothetical protein